MGKDKSRSGAWRHSALVVGEKSAFMKQLSLFQFLAAGLETVIRNGNPWWRGEPIAELPPFRRWAFEPVYRRL